MTAALRALIVDDAVITADGIAINGVVDRTVANAAFLHVANDSLKRFQILAGVAVHLHVANVAGVRQRMIRRLKLDFAERLDIVIHGNMEAVRVVLAVSHTGNRAVTSAVHAHEATRKAFGGRSKQRVVHVRLLRQAVQVRAHVAHNFQAKLLRLSRFAVMFARERLQRFRQANKAHGKRAVLEHFAHFVIGLELFGVNPHALTHQERRIVHALLRLNLKALVQLAHAQVQLGIKQVEEQVNVAMGANSQARQVDRGKAQIAAAGRDFAAGVVDVAHNARTAAHVRNFGLGRTLVVRQVKRCVLEAEVGEQPFRGAMNCQLEQVVVWVTGIVVDAFLHAENLHGEDGRLARAQALFGSKKRIADDHAAFGGRIHAVVHRRERRLSTGAGMHGVQVVDQRLHGLERCAVGVVVRVLFRVGEHAFGHFIRQNAFQLLFKRFAIRRVKLDSSNSTRSLFNASKRILRPRARIFDVA